MGNANMLRIAEKLEKISRNNKVGALESMTLGETPSRYRLQKFNCI